MGCYNSDFTPEGYEEARIYELITINGTHLIQSLEMYYLVSIDLSCSENLRSQGMVDLHKGG